MEMGVVIVQPWILDGKKRKRPLKNRGGEETVKKEKTKPIKSFTFT
jgi:hypothetical protein